MVVGVDPAGLCSGYFDFVVPGLTTFLGRDRKWHALIQKRNLASHSFFLRMVGFPCSPFCRFTSSRRDWTSCFSSLISVRVDSRITSNRWITSGSENWFILSRVKVLRKAISSLFKVSLSYLYKLSFISYHL